MRSRFLPILVVTAFAASAGWAQTIYRIDSASQQIDGYFYPARVANGGKAPAVIALHGCGGMLNRQGEPNARTVAYSLLLNGQGWHVLFLDSFSARGVKSVCGNTNQVAQATRVADAQAAVAFLAGRPEVDARRIGILGWSHGATTALLADAATVRYALPVAAFAAFYPGCESRQAQRNWSPDRPLLMQLGALDDWTDPKPCQHLASRFPQLIDLQTHANAYHAFDSDEPVRQRPEIISRSTGKPVHAGGEPLARAASQTALIAFFKNHFR